MISQDNQLLETESVTIDFAEVQPVFEAKCEHDGLTVDLSTGLPEDQRDEIRQQRRLVRGSQPDAVGSVDEIVLRKVAHDFRRPALTLPDSRG
jgi:predicted nucleotidyltransferase component of viral defense system